MESDADSVDSVLGSLVTQVEAHVENIAAQRALQPLSRVDAASEQSLTSRADSASSAALSDDRDFANGAASVHRTEPATVKSSAQPGYPASSAPSQPVARGRDIALAGQPLLQAAGSFKQIAGPQKGLIVTADAPESLTKSSKLLVLKQRRLDSLSSSLDLSRESSFDTAALHPASQHVQPVDICEDTSSKSPLPLDSTTGVSLACMIMRLQALDAGASIRQLICAHMPWRTMHGYCKCQVMYIEISSCQSVKLAKLH